MSFQLEFLGGAGTVTGSKFLLTYNDTRVLIDCGLFQGLKSLRLKNWDGLSVEVSKIDAVILTHAHIDHSGYIPRLIKMGFRGKVYATAATKDLCKILLPDSGYLMEEEAEFLNRTRRTKHSPALPLFTQAEAEKSLRFFEPIAFNLLHSIGADIQFEFRYAGHILGAASVIIHAGGLKIAFTGDIGRSHDRIFFPPANLPEVDFVITESTYGNRLHKNIDVLEELAETINTTVRRGGVVLIPSFAVGRAQSLLHSLWLLKKQNRIPQFPMFLNSPMATNVNELLGQYKDLHKISSDECIEICNVVKYIQKTEDSIALNKKKGPMLIISASGMLTGGRVLHHLEAFAPFPENTILLTGYQAAGTRGETIANGGSEVKVHGRYVPIRAQVKNLDNMSAHADYSEIIEWFGRSKIQPRRVFVTHGEAAAADELRRRLSEKFGWDCCVPELGQKVILS